MEIREMRMELGDTQSEFAIRYQIFFRSIQNWETGTRKPPEYIVKDFIGEDILFVLDEALMCQGNFGGRSTEYIVWLYGDTSLNRFNGVAVLGKWVSPYCVLEKNGLKYTNLNRTISDSLANESILDMQGITEAVSRYYFLNGESFEGLSVAPEHQEAFERLAQEACACYDS